MHRTALRTVLRSGPMSWTVGGGPVTHVRWVYRRFVRDQVITVKANNMLHDDVIKWKHFPRYWPFVRGIHRSPVNSPHKGQWRGALMFTLICTRIKGWVNNREAGDLRRYRGHYDVTVMHTCTHTHIHPTDKTYFDGLELYCRNSSALAMQLLQSCTKQSILTHLPVGDLNQNFTYEFSEPNLAAGNWVFFYEIGLRWMSLHLIDE